MLPIKSLERSDVAGLRALNTLQRRRLLITGRGRVLPDVRYHRARLHLRQSYDASERAGVGREMGDGGCRYRGATAPNTSRIPIPLFYISAEIEFATRLGNDALETSFRLRR